MSRRDDYYWYERLCRAGYKNQLDRLIDAEYGVDIGPEFLGFLDVYYHLSKIIPLGRTVIDLGCAYAPQAAFFTKHKAYIGVDVSDCPRLKTPNSEHFVGEINKYITDYLPSMDVEKVFAICSYVPTSTESLRKSFSNLFVFYPQFDDDPKLKKAEKMFSVSTPQQEERSGKIEPLTN